MSPETDQQIDLWCGRIAAAAAKGGGLNEYKAALLWVKDNVPSDLALREGGKQTIQNAAERHLNDIHDATILDAIHFSIFPDDAATNDELDALANKNDAFNEIERLAKLGCVEYALERKTVAGWLGIPVGALNAAVKAARTENGDTKGQGRPLELPAIEPWPEAVNGAELLDSICAGLRRYLVLPVGSAEIIALWVVHTHAFECFECTPRLAITSPEKRCGKTTTLDVIENFVAKPLPTSNIKSAGIFRTIEMASPTLLIDEADTFLKEDEASRGILNNGHKRGGQTIRLVGESYEPRLFSTWCPVAIAMIGRLSDTLEDRSVSIVLRRRRPTERVQQFRSDRAQDLKQLARKIARWTTDNREALASADPFTGMLVNRSADNWRPLLAIADLAGGPWPKRARAVANTVETAKQDQSKRTMVLSDIRDFFAARPEANRVASAELAGTLGAMEDRPWPEWRNGKPITPAALARLLGPFGIAPGTKRDGGHTFKGYLLSDFEEAFATYLPDQTVTPSQPNNGGLCDASQTVTLDRDVTASKASQPNNGGLCDGVTVQTGVSSLEDVNGLHCDHCQQPGEDDDPLLVVFDGERDTRLHRACSGVWELSKQHQHRKDLTMTDEMSVEQWLAIRKEAGLKIDPETAEVEWWYALVLDPYGVNPEIKEVELCVGREYFAREPGSDIWVCFSDLPEKTSEALWDKHSRRLAFPAGLEELTCARNSD